MNVECTIEFKTTSKVLFFMYVVYEYVTSYALFAIPGFSSFLLLSSFLMYMAYISFNIELEKSIVAFIMFSIYSLFSGFFISQNFTITFRMVINLVEFIIVAFLIISYIKDDKKPDFVIYVFVFQAILAVLLATVKGVGDERISIAEGVNVNGLGVIFSFSIAFILYMLIDRKKNVVTIIVTFASIIFLVYGITLTASKKAIISAGAIIITWFLFCFNDSFKSKSVFYRGAILILIVLLSILVVQYYMTTSAERVQIVQDRMGELYAGNSDQIRLLLIKEGFLVFLNHPICGVGLNNVNYYTSIHGYTHCFYSEIVAGSGIIGTIIFCYGMFRPLGILLYDKFIYTSCSTLYKTQTRFLLVIFLVLLFINFTQIIYFENYLMYILSIIIGVVDLLYAATPYNNQKHKYIKNYSL